MRRRFLASCSLLIVAAVMMISGSGPALAQQNSNSAGGNALRISPVRTDATIKPGESQAISVFLQNLTPTPANLRGIVNDFVANKDESGQPNIILDENQSAPTHSLKQFIKPLGELSLKPNEQKEVKVVVAVPKDAKAGGYYGAVRFAPASAAGDKNVTLSASVGSLILVKVPGDIKEDLSIASFGVKQGDRAGQFFTSNKNLKVTVRFKNSGDVQEEPFGKVLLKRDKKTLASYEINNTDPPGNVLPDSIRKFDVALGKVGSFGKYTVEGNFGYGDKGQLITARSTFYVMPLGMIAGVAALIVIIVLAIFVLPRLVRRYNERVVQKATGRRK